MTDNQLRVATTLLAQVPELSQDERAIIKTLYDKGPGLPIEIAVRILILPDDVQQPLQSLQAKNIVKVESFSAGEFGNQVFSLTDMGEQMADLLEDQADVRPTREKTDESIALNEAELLKSLGDLDAREGRSDAAREKYEEALKIYRRYKSG